MHVRSLTLLCVCLVNFSAAWDPFGIGGSIADKIRDAGDHLIGTAKEAFEEAVRDVITQDVDPLIDKVNAMILEDVTALKEDVEELVHNATMEIIGLIDHCAEVAQKFMDHTIDEIKDKIIDEARNAAIEVENNFFQGLSNFLQKLYALVEKVNCMARGDIDKIYEDIYKLIGDGCVIPDYCCRKQGLYFKTLKEMGDSQLYDLEVCRRSDGNTEKTTIIELQKTYMDMQISAKKFYCIDVGTGSAREYFTKEYNKWGVEYNAWAHPPIGACKGELTPPQCYQAAVSSLMEARKDLPYQASVAQVKQLVASAMPTGTIMAWAGLADKIPLGWQLCDGTGGTPDLRAKFIRACQSGQDCSGQLGGGTSNTTNKSVAHSHGGNAVAHALTIAEMPAHRHTSGAQSEFVSFGGVGPKSGWRHTSKYDRYINPYTTTVGSTKAHSHPISDDGVHTHTVDITPPFYNLAFIRFKGVGTYASHDHHVMFGVIGDARCTSPEECYAESASLLNQTYNDTASKADTNQVHTELLTAVPSTSIAMWSGSPDALPVNWHLCDGSSSTPNLSGMFLRSCERTVNGTCNVGATGGSSRTSTSIAGQHSHGTKSGAHVLTIEELPAHNHVSGEQGEFVSFGGVPHTPGWRHNSAKGTYVNPYTTKTGGNKGHMHPIAADGAHCHVVDVTPPFVSLGLLTFHGVQNFGYAARKTSARSVAQSCGDAVDCYRSAIENIGEAITAIARLVSVKDVKAKIAAAVPTGLIAMREGEAGGSWTSCDGKAGTPDLNGKYIRACQRTSKTTCDIGSSGGALEHTTAAAGVHHHGAATGLHAVTVEEMAAHEHVDGAQSEFVSFSGWRHSGWRQESQRDKFTNPYTQNSGGNKAHSHGIIADGVHAHSVIASPAYHGISFVMFQGLPKRAKEPEVEMWV